MKIFPTISALLLLSHVVQAQAPAAAPPIPLRPLFDQIRGWSPEHAAVWSLTYRFHDRPALTVEQVWSRLADAAIGRPASDSIEQAAYAFAAGYRDALRQTFEGQGGAFIATDPTLPILVGEHRGQLAIVLEGFVYEDVFNTIRTTTRGRAVDVARALALTVIRRAGPLCAVPAVGFVGAEVVYGSKNFLDKAGTTLEAEVVTVVTPAAACRALIAGALSDDELLATADVYLQDRESHETRKITLPMGGR